MRLRFLIPSLAALFTLQAQASNFWISTNEYMVGIGSSVADEQWVLANVANVSGTFENDLFIGTVAPLEFSGIYQGDVWASSAMNIEIKGSCQQNVRLNSSTIRIDGSIAGNLLAVGNTVIISTNAMIHGNARVYAAKIVQEGVIKGDAALSAPLLVTFAGTIDGDVSVASQEIIYTSEARIAGNLEYQSLEEHIPSEGIIGGQISKKALPSLFNPGRLQFILIAFVAAIMAGIPFITLFPMTTAMSAQLIKRSPGKCLLAGFITSIVLPIFGLLCFSSTIGIPLGILLLGSSVAMAYISHILIALTVGNLVLIKMGNSIGKVLLAMAIGLALIYASFIFPTIGFPIAIMALWLGMGSLIVALIEKRRLILQVPANLQKLQQLRDENYNPEEDES